MSIIKFGRDEFSMLSMSEDLASGGQTVGTEILKSEGDGLVTLASLASADGDFNENELLYVVCDEDLILERVYEPAVFVHHDDDGSTSLILRTGSNEFPVVCQKGKLIANLIYAADVSIEKKETDKKEWYPLFSMLFTSDELKKNKTYFKIGLRVDGKKYPTKTESDCDLLHIEVKEAIADGSIADFLMEPGTGGSGKTYAMQDLDVGEFTVDQITELLLPDQDKPGETRLTYVLKMGGGDSVWAKGGVLRVLNDPKKGWEESLKSRNLVDFKTSTSDKVVRIWDLKTPVTLKISKIEQTSKGWSVSCKLSERQAVLAGVVEVQAQLMPATATANGKPDLNAIPF
jgi:hypothetical protein